jgi:hypothetical protein
MLSKPQQKGGGYNFYDDQLVNKKLPEYKKGTLTELKLGKELAKFFLMERLFPPKQSDSIEIRKSCGGLAIVFLSWGVLEQ